MFLDSLEEEVPRDGWMVLRLKAKGQPATPRSSLPPPPQRPSGDTLGSSLYFGPKGQDKPVSIYRDPPLGFFQRNPLFNTNP